MLAPPGEPAAPTQAGERGCVDSHSKLLAVGVGALVFAAFGGGGGAQNAEQAAYAKAAAIIGQTCTPGPNPKGAVGTGSYGCGNHLIAYPNDTNQGDYYCSILVGRNGNPMLIVYGFPGFGELKKLSSALHASSTGVSGQSCENEHFS